MNTNRETGSFSPSVTETVVDCVARDAGCDPLELPPLWEVIDTDALNELFLSTRATDRSGGRIVFSYCGYHVTVDAGEGAVTLDRIEA